MFSLLIIMIGIFLITFMGVNLIYYSEVFMVDGFTVLFIVASVFLTTFVFYYLVVSFRKLNIKLPSYIKKHQFFPIRQVRAQLERKKRFKIMFCIFFIYDIQKNIFLKKIILTYVTLPALSGKAFWLVLGKTKLYMLLATHK